MSLSEVGGTRGHCVPQRAALNIMVFASLHTAKKMLFIIYYNVFRGFLHLFIWTVILPHEQGTYFFNKYLAGLIEGSCKMQA